MHSAVKKDSDAKEGDHLKKGGIFQHPPLLTFTFYHLSSYEGTGKIYPAEAASVGQTTSCFMSCHCMT
jgi:hypothetical protein